MKNSSFASENGLGIKRQFDAPRTIVSGNKH